QCHHGGEKKRHPHKSAGDLARFFRRRLKGYAEDHSHEQREEDHGIQRVFRAPLEAEVLLQVEQRYPQGVAHRVTSRAASSRWDRAVRATSSAPLRVMVSSAIAARISA